MPKEKVTFRQLIRSLGGRMHRVRQNFVRVPAEQKRALVELDRMPERDYVDDDESPADKPPKASKP